MYSNPSLPRFDCSCTRRQLALIWNRLQILSEPRRCTSYLKPSQNRIYHYDIPGGRIFGNL